MANWVFDQERISRWVLEKASGNWVPWMTGIALEVDGVLKVGVCYEAFTGKGGSILMHSRCDDAKVPTKEFYKMIFWYPFDQLGVKRCTLLVNENNRQALKVNDKLGFTREAILKNYFPDGDAIVFRMYREECKYLTGCDTAKIEDVSQHVQQQEVSLS